MPLLPLWATPPAAIVNRGRSDGCVVRVDVPGHPSAQLRSTLDGGGCDAVERMRKEPAHDRPYLSRIRRITTARAIDLTEGVLPAGNAGTIVQNSEAHQAEVYLVEFPAPWHVVPLAREDIILSDDDEQCRAGVQEFEDATPEQKDHMIEMVRQASRDIRADLIAEHGEELEVRYEDITGEQKRSVDGGRTVADQFPMDRSLIHALRSALLNPVGAIGRVLHKTQTCLTVVTDFIGRGSGPEHRFIEDRYVARQFGGSTRQTANRYHPLQRARLVFCPAANHGATIGTAATDRQTESAITFAPAP